MRPGVLSAIAACFAIACGSTSVTQVSGPDDVRCQTTLTAQPAVVGADGGAVTISVKTTRDCAWSASSEASWIRLSTSSGQGESSFTANVDANPQITSRAADVAVNAQRTHLTQEARPCTFDVSPGSAEVDGAGGTAHVTVATIAGCAWRSSSGVSWITVPADTRSGSGAIDIQVQPNPGGARDGVITIAERMFMVSQGAAAAGAPAAPGPGPTPTPGPATDCTATLRPTTVDVAAEASTQTLQVEIAPSCNWTAVSAAGWVTITTGAAGHGSGVVTLAVAQNSGAARTTILTVAGRQAMVRQAAAAVCTYSLDPASASIGAPGGAGRFTVKTQAGCAWAASSGVPWISVATPTGNGTGDVSFSVQANNAIAARSGSITAGGQSFTVNQAAEACTYSLAPASANLGAEGGSTKFTITTQAGCAWSASAGAAWVTIASPTGTGSGDVTVTVQPNGTAAPRSTTVSVGGQTFTVNEAAGAACTYSLSPASADIGANGGDGRFTLTTQAGCAWTAAAAAQWVTVGTPSGAGSGDIAYTVQANGDTAARTTTISVGGQAHTISQAGVPPPCTYSIDPASGAFGAGGGSSTFHVTTQAGCAWSAAVNADWVTVTTSTGTGSGDVAYAVAANSTMAPRSATISVGGQSYAVTEAAP